MNSLYLNCINHDDEHVCVMLPSSMARNLILGESQQINIIDLLFTIQKIIAKESAADSTIDNHIEIDWMESIFNAENKLIKSVKI